MQVAAQMFAKAHFYTLEAVTHTLVIIAICRQVVKIIGN